MTRAKVTANILTNVRFLTDGKAEDMCRECNCIGIRANACGEDI